jgi:hypothetical protein
MKVCNRSESGDLELFFYDELGRAEREAMRVHLAICADCRRRIEELTDIRAALDSEPAVDAPPSGDWSEFMRRLDDAVAAEARLQAVERQARIQARQPAVRRSISSAYLMAAAALAMMAMSLAYVAYSVSREPEGAPATAIGRAGSPVAPASERAAPSQEQAFASLSEQHFERSKLVVLGVASKDPHRATDVDWEYERHLASSLLSDTRLYRLAAEQHGMTRIASVMGDLELVLLQTSLAEGSRPQDLEQIQRLISKRDLVTKMNVRF